MKGRVTLSIAAAMTVLVLLAGVAYLTAASGSEKGSAVTVVVEPGWSASRIASELEKRKVVTSGVALRVYLKLHGSASALKAGRYGLRRDMPFRELLGRLREGPDIKFVKVTIPEGSTVEQTAALIAAATHIAAPTFLDAATASTTKPAILPEGVSSLEGFLYPSTYFVAEKETAPDLVKRLVDQFARTTGSIDWGKSSSFGVTPFQSVIVASMVEEEAKVAEERPLIAAVVYNRLRRGMRLEIDATIQFAVRKYGKPLTEDDLAVDSPYNTRRYAGLPPGPISSPRLDSIKAALDPTATDSIYYVLTEDCKHHFFTSNYDLFLEAKSRQRSDC